MKELQKLIIHNQVLLMAILKSLGLSAKKINELNENINKQIEELYEIFEKENKQ